VAECWASALGSCSEKISREHLISDSLFVGNVVRVQGFSWCKEAKEIGLSSLTSKILCKKHNEDLSPVDIAGSSAFKTFREMRRLANVRQAMKPQKWKVVRYQIDGILLERWFLKTLINIAWGGEFPIGKVSLAGKPSEELTRIAFGLSSFGGRAGLYSIVHAGQNVNSTDRIGFAPLLKDKTYIAGGLFSFRGFRFLLFLMPQGPPTPLDAVLLDGEDVGKSQLNYHNRRIDEYSGRHKSQVLEIKW
jgi:hypothetical protein